MTGMASCREIRHALGVYVLGAIEPAERALVEEHLATCLDCREELASLAGLPAMLRKVPIVEAERLAASDTELDGELPSEEMLESLVARTANVRRMHRWRRVAAAAAVIVVAAGGGAAVATALQPSAPPAIATVAWRMAIGTGPVPGVHLTVRYRHVAGGTVIEAHATGLRPGAHCQFQVTDSGGNAWQLGGWVQESWKPAAWYPASIWLGDKNLRSFQVLVNGEVVATAPT